MIAIIISGITCALFVGTFLLGFVKSKGVYDEYLEKSTLSRIFSR